MTLRRSCSNSIWDMRSRKGKGENVDEQPLVSVIVPVYNVERFLDRCMRSLVGQTYRRLEIILVDDGSSDGSPELCDEWAKRDARVRVIHKLNGGPSEARNVALDDMHGDFVAFVDSDDYVEPDYVERLYTGIGDADMSMYSIVCEDSNGIAWSEDGTESANETVRLGSEAVVDVPTVIGSEEYIYRATLDWRLVVVWNKLYRASVWKNLRFPVGLIHEDEYVMPQVVDRCGTINVLPDGLYHYMANDSSITHSDFGIRNLDRLEALTWRMKYCVDKNYRRCVVLTFDEFIKDLDLASGLDWSDREIHAKLKKVFKELRRVPLSAGFLLPVKRRLQFFGLWFAPFLTERILKKVKNL